MTIISSYFYQEWNYFFRYFIFLEYFCFSYFSDWKISEALVNSYTYLLFLINWSTNIDSIFSCWRQIKTCKFLNTRLFLFKYFYTTYKSGNYLCFNSKRKRRSDTRVCYLYGFYTLLYLFLYFFIFARKYIVNFNIISLPLFIWYRVQY